MPITQLDARTLRVVIDLRKGLPGRPLPMPRPEIVARAAALLSTRGASR